MFLPQQVHHRHCLRDALPNIPLPFSVLCWNVYKKNREDGRFAAFVQSHQADLLLFQEANFKNGDACRVDGYSYDAAANIRYKENNYGVLTASRAVAEETKAYLSKHRELFFATHKSLLISRYRLENGDRLLVVNVHAINFREDRAYVEEKSRILTFLENYDGALLIAGDFNAWSRSRSKQLLQTAKRLGMKRVPFRKSEPVKAVFGNHLDFIFYRKLKLLAHEVPDDGGISDHRPLFAKFDIL